jgi:hypothetical protein
MKGCAAPPNPYPFAKACHTRTRDRTASDRTVAARGQVPFVEQRQGRRGHRQCRSSVLCRPANDDSPSQGRCSTAVRQSELTRGSNYGYLNPSRAQAFSRPLREREWLSHPERCGAPYYAIGIHQPVNSRTFRCAITDEMSSLLIRTGKLRRPG